MEGGEVCPEGKIKMNVITHTYTHYKTNIAISRLGWVYGESNRELAAPPGKTLPFYPIDALHLCYLYGGPKV